MQSLFCIFVLESFPLHCSRSGLILSTGVNNKAYSFSVHLTFYATFVNCVKTAELIKLFAPPNIQHFSIPNVTAIISSCLWHDYALSAEIFIGHCEGYLACKNAVSAVNKDPLKPRSLCVQVCVYGSDCLSVRPAATARHNATLVSAAKVMRCIQCSLVVVVVVVGGGVVVVVVYYYSAECFYVTFC